VTFGAGTYGAATTITSIDTTGDTAAVDAHLVVGSTSGATFASGAGQSTFNGAAGVGSTDTVTGGTGIVIFTETGAGALTATLGDGGNATTQQSVTDTQAGNAVITVTAGNGQNTINISGSTGAETVTLGNGGTSTHSNAVTLGNGTDSVSVGTGFNTVTLGTGVDTLTFGSHVSTTTSHDTVVVTVATAGAVNTAASSATSFTFATAVTNATGLVAGDKINLAAVVPAVSPTLAAVSENNAQLTATNLAGQANAGATSGIALAEGTYNATTHAFTYSATGPDSLLTFDTSNAGAANYHSIVLVGYHQTTTDLPAVALGILTL